MLYTLSLSTIIIFALAAIFILPLTMPMDKNGQMTHCPLMNSPLAICQMSALEHIAQWQRMFSAISPLNALFLIIALLSFSFAFVLLYKLRDFDRNELYQIFYKRYQSEHPHIPLFDYLRRVFSSGILEPKIYA